MKIAIAAEFELCEKITECLQQSLPTTEKLSIVEIYPFSEEQGIRFNNRAVEQLKAEETEWSEFDYLLFAGDISHAAQIAEAAESGCVVIDMKGVCAMLSDVPVVVPTVNDERLSELRQRNIVCLPDSQVSQLALAVNELLQQNVPLNRLFVTSLLPASYANSETVGRLAGQTARLLNGLPIEDDQQRLAFDVFPTESSHPEAQLQKILPQINGITFHQIRVPVFYGISQKVTALSDYTPDYERLIIHWNANGLIQYEEKPITAVTNGENESGESEVKLHIGNLKPLESAGDNGIEFWTVADDQRFNLALLAVKLLEQIYRQGY